MHGALENTRLIKLNQSITLMDAYQHAKKASPRLKSFKDYLKAL